MQKQRDVFIDGIKIYACILVVLGHFFQSMVSSNILSSSPIIEWFDTTIYYFHVPLFFICSGYLFCKYSVVNSFSQYKGHVIKKLLSLGIPYLVFSVVTWGLKVLFSSQVNNQADSLFTTLFIDPVSPYWYLYTLFFIFLITPSTKSKKGLAVLLFMGLCMKIASFFISEQSAFVIVSVTINEIWFVLGMCLHTYSLDKIFKKRGFVLVCGVLSVSFVGASIFYYGIKSQLLSFLLGFVACVATVILAIHTQNLRFIKKCVSVFSKYTMPVFLMHTIFAASMRALLIKLSITSAVVHIAVGITISFLGPIVTYAIMSKFKATDFIFNPTKYVRFNKQEKPNG